MTPRNLTPNNYPKRFVIWRIVLARNEPTRYHPTRPYDHTIPLQEGKEPPYGKLYAMSADELKARKAVGRSWHLVLASHLYSQGIPTYTCRHYASFTHHGHHR